MKASGILIVTDHLPIPSNTTPTIHPIIINSHILNKDKYHIYIIH